MANIRINSLPATTTVLPGDVLPMDGASTRKITPADLLSSVRPISTQSQAEAGTDNTTSMTPLGTAQAIASKLPNTAAGRAMLNAANPAAQRALLTLGDAALANVGSSAGTVAAGDDIRFAGVAGIVDQATAEAGTNNTGIMSPLRTKQQIDARRASSAEAALGTDQAKLMTPYLAASALSARLNYIRIQDDKYVQLGLDPTNTTDSFAALTQAFADATTSGKRHLVIAGGTYRQSGTITIGGDDFRLSFEEGAAIASAPSVFSPTMLQATNRTGIRIENPRYQGNGIVKPGNKGNTPQALYFVGCHDMVITDPKLSNFRGTNIACVNANDVAIEGGLFTNFGQEAGAATGDAPGTFGASPGIYLGGGKNQWVRNATFKNGGFSGVFFFGQAGGVTECYFENIGESAIYSESIDPAGNNGLEVVGNEFSYNTVNGTHVVDISAAGLETMIHDLRAIGNRVTFAGTHGIVCGLGNRQVVQGNVIGNCNQGNYALNAGICATVHTGVWNAASQQGDQISIIGNVIYDQQSKMKSGILWHSLDTANYVFRRAVDQGNSFQGLPAGKERDFTVGCMVDDPTLAYAPTIGPDSAWKKDFRAAAGASPTNATTATVIKATSIPPHYMLNNGGIRIKAEGDFINNINSAKNVRLYFQGAQVGNFSTTGAGSWSMEVDIINTAYNAQQTIFRYTVGGVPAVAFSSGGFGTNAASAIEIRGDVANASDFVRCFSLSVEKITG